MDSKVIKYSLVNPTVNMLISCPCASSASGIVRSLSRFETASVSTIPTLGI